MPASAHSVLLNSGFKPKEVVHPSELIQSIKRVQYKNWPYSLKEVALLPTRDIPRRYLKDKELTERDRDMSYMIYTRP